MPPYSGVYVFGDSLVDSGNALKLAEWYDGLPLQDLPDGAPTTSDGYFEGRFADGYTYADYLSNKYAGAVTKSVFPFGFEDPWIGVPINPFAGDPSGNNSNFAYGGAQVRQGGEVVPDFDGQTDAFRDAVDGHADLNALYLFTIANNDVRSFAPTGGDPAAPDQLIPCFRVRSGIDRHDFASRGGHQPIRLIAGTKVTCCFRCARGRAFQHKWKRIEPLRPICRAPRRSARRPRCHRRFAGAARPQQRDGRAAA